MNRREFIAAGAAAGAVVAAGSLMGQAPAPTPTDKTPFKMKFAPHFGMFENLAGDDLIDQLKFAADEGFSAWEDNGMGGRSVDEQEKIAAAMVQLNITMGVFVALADFDAVTFASTDPANRERILKAIKEGVEVAKRVNAKWFTVVPGQFDPGLEWDYQTAYVIDNLKYCAEICEPAGVTMVLEPLNPWSDHPKLFLTKVPQAYQICRAVGSPSCKILDDLYHQQITEGNLIPNIDRAYSEIAYFQIGDNPGRKEPTTGEINFKNIFKHIQSKGYTGVLGMEHGIKGEGKEGELALLKAYRSVDCD